MIRLRDYQERMLHYASQATHPAWFVEMRLGKTVVAIRWAHSLEGSTYVVIAPLSVLGEWRRQIEGEAVHPDAVFINPQTVNQKCWNLFNYERVLARPELREGIEAAACVILDESTRIANPNAKISKLLCLYDIQGRKALLSGLPWPEHVLQLFQQAKFLRGQMFGISNWWNFRHQYFRQQGFDWVPKPGTMDKIKRFIDQECFRLTRRQAGINLEVIHSRRVVKMDPAQRRAYQMTMKNYETPAGQETKWATSLRIWLQRIAGGYNPDTKKIEWLPKVRELVQLLKGDLRDESIVIWCHFRAEIRYLRKELKALKRSDGSARGVRCIHGGTKRAARDKYAEEFRTGKVMILISQIRTGMFGNDYSRADTAIYYSNDASMQARKQSQDRILSVAKGQSKHGLYAIDLCAEDTVDEIISQLIAEKKMSASAVDSRLVASMARTR